MTNTCLSDRPNCKLKFHHVHLDAKRGGKIGLCFKDGAFTEKQENLIDKMFNGFELTKHRIMCGNPSMFTLRRGNEDGGIADKRTVNALIKRNVIVYDAENKSNTRFASMYKLNLEKF